MHGQSQDCYATQEYDAFIQAGFSILTPSRPGYGKTPASVGDSAEKAVEAMVDLLWSHFPWFGPHSEEELDR